MGKPPTDHRILSRARKLRSTMTRPERALWSILRSRQLGHLKFRRQHPIGPYVTDFYCHSARLAVELDGMSHDGTVVADARRSGYLQQAGLRVLRITNDDVIIDPDAVAEWIATEATQVSAEDDGRSSGRQRPSPQPSPGGRGSEWPSPQPSPGGRGSI